MKINFAREFIKQYCKADSKIKEATDKRLELFSENHLNPILNNHPLTGDYKDYRSINITGDWRAVYSESYDENDGVVIFFKSLGTHSQLYK